MLFYFPRKTYNQRLSENRMSEIELFSDNIMMLRNVAQVKRKELQKALAKYKFHHGLGNVIEVIFLENGKKIAKNIDGSPKEIKSITIKEKYDIPAVYISIRL